MPGGGGLLSLGIGSHPLGCVVGGKGYRLRVGPRSSKPPVWVRVPLPLTTRCVLPPQHGSGGYAAAPPAGWHGPRYCGA
jgi:hypothetical protein